MRTINGSQDFRRGLQVETTWPSDLSLLYPLTMFAYYVCSTNIPNSNLVRGDNKETVSVMMTRETREV